MKIAALLLTTTLLLAGCASLTEPVQPKFDDQLAEKLTKWADDCEAQGKWVAPGPRAIILLY